MQYKTSPDLPNNLSLSVALKIQLSWN